MSNPISKLEVFNGALGLLEQDELLDVSEDGFEADELRNKFPFALRTTLKAHRWDFATRFASLSLISAADNPSPFSRLYKLPNDFLEFQRVFEGDDDPIEYMNTADGLYTDSTAPKLQYTIYTADFSKFDEDFTTALMYELASLASAKILGSTNTSDFLDQQSGKRQGIAASKSAGRIPKKYKLESSYVTSRSE